MSRRCDFVKTESRRRSDWATAQTATSATKMPT